MSNTQRIALILGASGGVGGETASALERHGWTIRALARDPERARTGREGWTWIAGDALDAAVVAEAAQGAEIIVHAVNPPGYRNWAGLVLPMLESTIAAAHASGARILLPGTIYNYGADAFPLLREDSPQTPATRKGAIRVEMERRLEAATETGVRSLVLRAGDFFGPRPGNSWFSQGMVKPGKPVRAIMYPGDKGVGHTWAYLPDVGEAFARLADIHDRLEPFARFHFAGHWDADGAAMTSAIARAAGRPGLKPAALPWPLLGLVAPFNETLRELIEMRPFWQAPVQLDNSRLIALLGEEPRTALDKAVHETLRGLGCLPG